MGIKGISLLTTIEAESILLLVVPLQNPVSQYANLQPSEDDIEMSYYNESKDPKDYPPRHLKKKSTVKSSE